MSQMFTSSVYRLKTIVTPIVLDFNYFLLQLNVITNPNPKSNPNPNLETNSNSTTMPEDLNMVVLGC